jgi:hypothetical protein
LRNFESAKAAGYDDPTLLAQVGRCLWERGEGWQAVGMEGGMVGAVIGICAGWSARTHARTSKQNHKHQHTHKQTHEHTVYLGRR